MAETAIVVLFPELETLVGSIRATSTEDGARAMPPHVTLIFPFADTVRVDEQLPAVRNVLAGFRPFDVSFAAIARWPETLYLVPSPAEPLVAMTEALANAFPEHPPYGGAFDEIVPHLTVAHGASDEFDGIAAELSPALPLRARVERAWLMAHETGGWRRHTAFPLDRR
jgi:2'-5' RNA ligase